MLRKIRPYIIDFFKRADMLLLSLCTVSSIFGIVLIYSATLTYETPRYVIVQILALLIGLGLFVLLTIIDIDIIADKWLILFIFSVLFMGTLLLWGESGGTTNTGWLRFMDIGIQPAEVVKVIFTVLMAKHITYLKEFKNLNSVLSVGQLAIHFAFMFALVILVSSDLGSALVFLFIFLIMMFFAGLKIYWFILGIASVAAVTPLIWNNFLSDLQKDRIRAPYMDSIDPSGSGVNWQTNHSKMALASGRLTGTGLGNGTQIQSDGAIPGKHTDFIFAVAGEELGLIACVAITLLLTLIIIRCVYIGIKSKNTMSMLICIGVAGIIFFQTFENIGMCIGLTPVVGLTLPFFSYGGSSLFSLFAAMGIVSGIRYRPKPERFQALN